MNALGFPDNFTKLVRTCITTPKFCLMINGSPTSLITPKRGLRQGSRSPISSSIHSMHGVLHKDSEEGQYVRGV